MNIHTRRYVSVCSIVDNNSASNMVSASSVLCFEQAWVTPQATLLPCYVNTATICGGCMPIASAICLRTFILTNTKCTASNLPAKVTPWLHQVHMHSSFAHPLHGGFFARCCFWAPFFRRFYFCNRILTRWPSRIAEAAQQLNILLILRNFLFYCITTVASKVRVQCRCVCLVLNIIMAQQCCLWCVNTSTKITTKQKQKKKKKKYIIKIKKKENK